MRATGRRERKADPLASLEAVHSVIQQMRQALPNLIPQKDKELARLLRADRHARRHPATDTKRGRPAKWKREGLLRVAARLEDILGRETSSHISFASSVDHYLRLPDFPSEDVFDDEIEELLRASEPILAILSRIQRRKEQTKIVKVQL